MYQAHFGFRQRPFPATLDTDCYYPATGHERALARLRLAVHDHQGLALLTGDPGTGKTLICHRLLDQLPAATATAFLTNSHVGNPAGFFQAVLYDLGLPYAGRGEQELRLTLTDFLLQNFKAGRQTVLVIDEAQHLTPDVLEEVRLLGNLEAHDRTALQVVLAGQPRVLETLRRQELAGLRQRLAVRVRLGALGLHEAADYLAHHVRIAGGRPAGLFSEEALEVLAQGTRGVPRLLNQAAHQALTLAASAGATVVDAEAALEALADLALGGDDAAGAGNVSTLLGDGSHNSAEPGDEGENGAVLPLDEDDGPPDMSLLSENDKPKKEGRPHRLFAPPSRPA